MSVDSSGSSEKVWSQSEKLHKLIISYNRHVLAEGKLVLGARRSLLDAGAGGGSATLRCRASNRAGTVLSRPVLLQPGKLEEKFKNVRYNKKKV
ncbi:unnamed protein product [Diatraea saccharalis]|uniref:Uncharacterized protein n=1 Tax=Diatraea saccharalis TaxID=40085 RepID=A0A9N9W9C8_9NEOP|nr:unnamed protein product [Diatraea saccharalis]